MNGVQQQSTTRTRDRDWHNGIGTIPAEKKGLKVIELSTSIHKLYLDHLFLTCVAQSLE